MIISYICLVMQIAILYYSGITITLTLRKKRWEAILQEEGKMESYPEERKMLR